ncbi:dienelactone hydrolase family protein [Ideonella sp.]|uniref:carboxylesterase family protein n=1 Tax=Ideonella sp. TaxID=1929293 RepID=UPI0035B2DCBD
MTNPPDIDRRSLLGLPLALAAAAGHAATAPADGHQAEWATPASLTLQATLRHWLYLPAGYHERPDKAWPLIVFLHGSGERGAQLDRVKAHGLPKLLAAGQAIPAIVVSPQCDDDLDWDPHLLHALLLALRGTWRIDPRRVSATGLSMGGGGCWDWAMAYPDDLAGIAPVCGYGSHLRLARMRGVPVRAYHGADDSVVPLSAQQTLVTELRGLGGQAELTIYPGVGHDAWNPAYADPALLAWLLARVKAGA